jgi:hypothetical protein
MSKQVRIIIDKQGGISIKAEGYQGMTCKDATKIFETLGKEISSAPTADAYAQDQIQGIEITNVYT